MNNVIVRILCVVYNVFMLYFLVNGNVTQNSGRSKPSDKGGGKGEGGGLLLNAQLAWPRFWSKK